MRLFFLNFVIFFLFSTATINAQEDKGASLNVRVEAVKNIKGELGIALFENKKGYPTHIEHAYEPVWIPLKEGMSIVEHGFEGLPAGDYAVSVLHDEDGDREMDRTKMGFPDEGVGFSNDQKVKFSAPDYDDCKFDLAEGEDKKIVIQMDYRD